MSLNISMYVKAYLELSSKSLSVFGVASWPVHLGAWLGGSRLPWRAVPCLLFAFLLFCETSVGMVLFFVSRFHLHNGRRPN